MARQLGDTPGPANRTQRREQTDAVTFALPVIRLVTAIPVAAGPINVNPNDNGLPGIAALRTIVGAVMTVGLILSVLALIVAAVVWAFGSHSANRIWQRAARPES